MKPFVIVCAVLMASAAQVHGGIVLNGSFESGLANWTVLGTADAPGTVYGVAPRDGGMQARVTNGSAVAASTIEGQLGLSPGRLTQLAAITNSNNIAQNGSAIFQTITAAANDELTFEWDFLTNEIAGFPFNQDDFAFWSVTNANNGEVLARASTPGLLPPPDPAAGFALHSQYRSGSITFAVGGTYTLGFGVINVNDTFGVSGLLIDNIQITAIPEPSSLLLLGLAAPAALLRRRKR